jgi:uncharacterized protein (DUF1810 family)
MSHNYNLERFIDAQTADYSVALSEIKHGKKQSHWMWYIFPQIEGLGFSSTSKYYAIKNIEEATAYLHHETLGPRLIEISNVLFSLKTKDAHKIFGSPDDLKLKSSMTLFSEVPGSNKIFKMVLEKFFNGEKDSKTLHILKQHN